MTADGLRLLQDLRRSLLDPPRHTGRQPSREYRGHRLTSPSTGTAPVLLHRIPDATDLRRQATTSFRSGHNRWTITS